MCKYEQFCTFTLLNYYHLFFSCQNIGENIYYLVVLGLHSTLRYAADISDVDVYKIINKSHQYSVIRQIYHHPYNVRRV